MRNQSSPVQIIARACWFSYVLIVVSVCARADASMVMTLVRITADDYGKIESGKLNTKLVLESKRPQLDLEKSWHGLHYLLAQDPTKTQAGAGQAILGGKEVGKDVGYGPARILSPKEVAAIARSEER